MEKSFRTALRNQLAEMGDDNPECPLDQAGKEGQIDFLGDDPREMTWGRRIALYMASNFKWYNPYLGEEKGPSGGEPPSLAKAWAFFEHVTLERYIVSEKDDSNRQNEQAETLWFLKKLFKGNHRLEIAEPGERQHRTKLYSPISTPLSQMGDFGLGYGVYFSTLRYYAVLCLLAGLLNIPNLLYFASDEYNAVGHNDSTSFLLKGSAICTDVTWVPCPDCPQDYKYQKFTFSKWSHSTGLYVTELDGGEWVNVSKYVKLQGVDHAVREESLYNYLDSKTGLLNGEVFQESTLAALERDFNVKITPTTIVLNDGTERICKNRDGEAEVNKCIEDYCWCQIESYQDCYCRFGNFPSEPSFQVNTLGFAEKNNCEGATLRNGYINMATIFLFIAGSILIQKRQNFLIVQFDEDEQTAQDYSICIMNPPPDAHDPNEWKAFFEDNFDCHVAVCTVDVDNNDFVTLLVKRRELLLNLKLLLPGVPLTREQLDKEATEGKNKKKIGANVLDGENVEEEIKTYLKQKRDHPARSVFVTFETEKGQREVLNGLSVGSWAARRNKVDSVSDKRHLFRGEHVLEIIEPEEPSAIRWQDLSSTTIRLVCGVLATSFVCLVLVIIAFVTILFCYRTIPVIAPIVTTVFTSVFPMIAKALMNLERHHSESSRQKWLFIKIAIFNILIASVLISVVTPFTASLDPTIESLPGLIPAVHALFFSQLGLTPTLQLLDIAGNLSRHVFAPRAKTQEEMNQKFGGAEMFLAERYANLIKFMFLIVYYCVLYPAALFVGCAAFCITYFADRFSLMRTWARTPQIGRQISDFARNYFTPTALALMAVLSAYAWSGFPYDNLCEYDAELDPSTFNKRWSLKEKGTKAVFFGVDLFRAPDVEETVVIPGDTKIYKYCHQDFRGYIDTRSFPPLPQFQMDEWMTEEQEDLLKVYGWVAVYVMTAVLVTFVARNVKRFVNGFKRGYSSRGDDQETLFSEIKAVDAYLPFHEQSMGYPLLLFDVSGVDPQLFSWTDPDQPHSHYDVTKDVSKVMSESEIQATHLFAQVKHWPHSPGDKS
eukprot:scaffold521_cov167-Amphora_coffeaeformis.AAC.11